MPARNFKAFLLGTACLFASGAAMAQPAPWEQQAAPAQPQAQAPLVPSQTPPVSQPAQPVQVQAPAASGLGRPGQSLGLTQDAWRDPTKSMGRDQSSPAFKRLRWTPDSVLQVNTREGLITTISLPSHETVVQTIVSDPGSIEVSTAPNRKAIVVKPVYAGIDGNVVIYGQSGAIYTIYVRSTTFNDKTLPDVRVAIEGVAPVNDVPRPGGAEAAPASLGPHGRVQGSAKGDTDPSASLTTPRAGSTPKGVDYAAVAHTGQGRLRTDLKILSSTQAATIIAPVAAWRDDKFTYLDFGPRAASMNTWPVAALVVDGVESPVGTRVSGPNRSVMVVESLGNITLRNGQHVVCIQLEVEDNDPRRPKVERTYHSSAKVPAPLPAHVEDVAPIKVVTTGPYTIDASLKLATEVVAGYKGRIKREQIAIVSGGRELTAEEILAVPPSSKARAYHLAIRELTPQQAKNVCSDLRHSGRSCSTR